MRRSTSTGTALRRDALRREHEGRALKSHELEVTESVRLFGEVHALWLQRPDTFASVTPGQFVMAYAGEGDDPFLGVALAISGVRHGEAGAEFRLLITARDRVTSWLTRQRPGDSVRIVGPLGHGFAPRERVQRMLLMAGTTDDGGDIGALVWLAERLASDGREVALILGGQDEAAIYPAPLLPPEVELVVATADGSLGEAGDVVPSFERLLSWCDQAFVSASTETQQAIYRVTRDRATDRPVQVLVRTPMACGTGLCDGCPVFPQRGGIRLACTDGPVFDLRDLYA